MVEAEFLVGEKAIIEAIKEENPIMLTYEKIEIPEGVEVKIDGKKVTVKGKNGVVEKDFSHARNVFILKVDNVIYVAAKTRNSNEKKPVRTIASKIRRMIDGVQREYIYKHKVIFAHFPIRVRVEGREIIVENFMGRKDKIRIPIYGENTKVEIKMQPGSDVPDEVIIRGPDLDAVSQTSGAIHDKLKLRGKFKKDPRVFMDGIWRYEIRREGEL